MHKYTVYQLDNGYKYKYRKTGNNRAALVKQAKKASLTWFAVSKRVNQSCMFVNDGTFERQEDGTYQEKGGK